MHFYIITLIYISIKEKGGYEMYRYKEAFNEGKGEIVVEVKEFETRKETRDYMNARVKEVKKNNKNWKTYYQDNSENLFEKEFDNELTAVEMHFPAIIYNKTGKVVLSGKIFVPLK